MKKVILFSTALFLAIPGFSQNVGIGTPTPTDAKLHVVTTDNATAGMFSNGTTGIGLLNELGRPAIGLNMYLNGGYKFKGDGFGGLFYYRPTDGSMTYYSSTATGLAGATPAFSPTMSWLAHGEVGIGTISPLAKLEVKGIGASSSTNTFSLRNSTGDTLLRMRDDGRVGIGYNGSSYGRTMNLGGTGVNFYTSNEAAFGGAIFPTDTSLVLWSNSGANNFVILQPSWGNTGIGTYTPNAKFHVNGAMLLGSNSSRVAAGYLLNVDGKIISEELKIQLSTSWPDYVFKNDYKLLSLPELEQSINQHQHLPNIPSAAEVEKDGILVGDMNKRLLEKVEELTLYLIDLNKKNTQLTEEVKLLKQEVKAIKHF
jgi:hypothetical protein